jgi:hypothetical protein
MEPCTMPTLGSAPAQSQCGCARTGQPVATEARDLSFLREPLVSAAAPERLSLAVPLVTVAFAAFVFARQRRPSTIVRLHLAGPAVTAPRGRFRLPRLALSPAERRVLDGLARTLRMGRPVSRPDTVAVVR